MKETSGGEMIDGPRGGLPSWQSLESSCWALGSGPYSQASCICISSLGKGRRLWWPCPGGEVEGIETMVPLSLPPPGCLTWRGWSGAGEGAASLCAKALSSS